MPLVGFGTARLRGDRLRSALAGAVADCGVRHIDCAKVYGNEHIVGEVLEQLTAAGTVQRKDLFVVSKLWNDDHRPEHVAAACRRTLSDLRLEYLDLYLVHWPTAWRKGTVLCRDSRVTLRDTWRAMERLVDEGLVRCIGVSNFDEERLKELDAVPPRHQCCVNQVEMHPRLAQPGLLRACEARSIVVTAWSPLAKHPAELSRIPAVGRLAAKKQCTAAQAVVAWHVARGVCAIPRSSSVPHIRENVAAAAIALDRADLDDMAEADRGQRLAPDFVGAFSGTAWYWKAAGNIVAAFAWFFWAVVPNWLDLRMPSS
eukprot:TRINITY_DN43136_c0_g1_i1.p2 TRINITY_DN43136_c0_g1~~TRINITY_DN43136_c0_g1_i1.p2  ORF type:complete len:345 (+),score=123.74 TRINITY_DN43136_c0_g1_i1:93-1037(+)